MKEKEESCSNKDWEEGMAIISSKTVLTETLTPFDAATRMVQFNTSYEPDVFNISNGDVSSIDGGVTVMVKRLLKLKGGSLVSLAKLMGLNVYTISKKLEGKLKWSPLEEFYIRYCYDRYLRFCKNKK